MFYCFKCTYVVILFFHKLTWWMTTVILDETFTLLAVGIHRVSFETKPKKKKLKQKYFNWSRRTLMTQRIWNREVVYNIVENQCRPTLQIPMEKYVLSCQISKWCHMVHYVLTSIDKKETEFIVSARIIRIYLIIFFVRRDVSKHFLRSYVKNKIWYCMTNKPIIPIIELKFQTIWHLWNK
jgi:hypothetical protein